MTNTYCVNTVLRYSWWWTLDLFETYRVLYQINLRNSASRWLSLYEYITMHGPLNVKSIDLEQCYTQYHLLQRLWIFSYFPHKVSCLCVFFFIQCHTTCPYGLRGLPSWHGSSVTDFWGWDAHEVQLRCPRDVSGDIGGWSARRALKPKFH
jgi:hypothetical protein